MEPDGCPRGYFWAPCMMTLAAPWISDRGGIERPSMGAAWVSAYTVAVASAAGGTLEDQARARMLPPPTIPPCYPFTRHISVSQAHLFPYRSLALSLSLSVSLRPPRILFPAVCPLRLSRHNFALPSPELCTFICHSPHPHCPLSAYPPRPNSCAPDIDFGRPTPPLMTCGHHQLMSLTPTLSLLCRRPLWPRRQTFSAWPPAIYVLSPTIGILVLHHWCVGLHPRGSPVTKALVSWPPTLISSARSIGLFHPNHRFPGPPPFVCFWGLGNT